MTPLTKRCAECKAEKPRQVFNKNKSKRDGLQSSCHECSRESARESSRRYRQTNLEAVRERDREYRRKHRQAHPEIVSKRQRENDRRWSRAHPDKVRARCATQRARKRFALDPSANKEAIAALHAEARIAEAFTGVRMAVDHQTPLARGAFTTRKIYACYLHD